MPVPTITSLNNAALDVAHISDIATSEDLTATDRLGNEKLTIAGVLAAFPNAAADAAAAEVSATAAEASKVTAEAAAAMSLIQPGNNADETAGRATVANGEYFKVVGTGDVAAVEYERIDAANSDPVAAYPSVNATRPGQRSHDELAFTANLFEIAACDFNTIIDAAGANDAFANFETTGHIIIKPGQLYTTSVAIFSLAYYDFSGAFISPLVVSAPATTTFTPPFTAYTVRVTFASGSGGANRQTMMIVEGGTIPGAYVHHSSAVSETGIRASFEDRSAEYIPDGRNIFDREQATDGFSFDPITGTPGLTVGYFVTGYIPVVPGRVYRTSHAGVDIIYYDHNKRFIKGEGTGWAAGTTKTMPAGAAYVRFDCLTTSLRKLHVSAGATAPASYQRFGGAPGPLVGKGIGFRGDSIWDEQEIQTQVANFTGGYIGFNECADGSETGFGLDEITAAALATTDILIMEHGINDWKNGVALGSIADAANATGSFYARLKAEYDKVFTEKPTIRVIRTTPTKTFTVAPFNFFQWDSANSAGQLQAAYVQAIKDVSAMYSVPVLDLFSLSNINATNQDTLLYDGLHWEAATYVPIGIQVGRFAEANF